MSNFFMKKWEAYLYTHILTSFLYRQVSFVNSLTYWSVCSSSILYLMHTDKHTLLTLEKTYLQTNQTKPINIHCNSEFLRCLVKFLLLSGLLYQISQMLQKTPLHFHNTKEKFLNIHSIRGIKNIFSLELLNHYRVI